MEENEEESRNCNRCAAGLGAGAMSLRASNESYRDERSQVNEAARCVLPCSVSTFVFFSMKQEEKHNFKMCVPPHTPCVREKCSEFVSVTARILRTGHKGNEGTTGSVNAEVSYHSTCTVGHLN
jgi:hypothetical protein